ncbi:MAG: sugar transferase [Desulfobacteraceae bacterium]|nr:MAG: sugar transferase [Desulfobacteraceae bacterium]
MDIVLGILLLPIALPILVVCAVAIKIDSPGPVVFVQNRTGKNGRRFHMYKLRTMVRNAEELKQRYMHLNELSYPDFKISDDPRITRVGRILRKTSLDELPQIFNALGGSMSLVGPRPTSFSSETYKLWHTARLELKPGLTGLWQVSGRNELDFDDRLRLDIAYHRHQCLSLDMKILFRTFGCIFSGRGAS